ncbi:MAG TPA: prepilin-type N-terminal cleavage/methylation domain-containing protein [Casimicrobiaceae bacterium]|nr:prepilin-type N-terminal cleavage/methylation domain-containing protein [Casimicrobiaceae bacterium]
MKAAADRGPSSRAPARAEGFSLLEVLAAFVILALVGTALFRVFSGALGNASLSDEYSRATLYGESRLALQGVETPLKEGVQQGTSDDGKYAWTAKVEPYRPAGSTPDLDAAAALMPVQLWRIAVTVSWPGPAGNDRSIALSTVRLAAKDLALPALRGG